MKYLAAVFAVFLIGGFVFAAGCVETTPSGPIQAGDNVTVEFTMYIGDTVMVTSNETKYDQILKAGKMPVPLILTEDPVVTAGATTDNDDLTISAKTHKSPYWFLKGEYNVIAGNIVGLEKGDTIRIPIYAEGTEKTGFWTNEQCEEQGLDKRLVKAGDRLTYTRMIGDATSTGDGEYDQGNLTNQQTMIHEMLILAVTDEGLTYQELYDTVEITIV
ncbi:MAG: hypothetical protein O0X93_02650 [Methanocorpusculum sp.]|uniref:Uncharacterized protein n=1 Tax=Methanocorpusculum petauri TaxID=3002863 RepID=A0ABT4IH39_9EURY|nr:hypothetical protein [Methanocorpusculum petauri]MDE2443616.1 hypothetical protein [Methanocorpusculum sp.]MCZ0860403.1 hypothetical protein [Methanocorpusculum petauri]MDE2519366.1 hypothetical protein [Methanocorpusculum sp.]MDE2522047.1 hypothetical protein [Methanocorpusculum sp.]MDE2524451.1 hypothetical protein [Methanocorpusculum sp.]